MKGQDSDDDDDDDVRNKLAEHVSKQQTMGQWTDEGWKWDKIDTIRRPK